MKYSVFIKCISWKTYVLVFRDPSLEYIFKCGMQKKTTLHQRKLQVKIIVISKAALQKTRQSFRTWIRQNRSRSFHIHDRIRVFSFVRLHFAFHFVRRLARWHREISVRRQTNACHQNRNFGTQEQGDISCRNASGGILEDTFSTRKQKSIYFIVNQERKIMSYAKAFISRDGLCDGFAKFQYKLKVWYSCDWQKMTNTRWAREGAP